MKRVSVTFLLFLLVVSGQICIFNNNKAVFGSKDIVVPDDFSSIQEAINWAEEGSTIIVRNGTYFEDLTINKPLSIIGLGASIMGKGHSNVVKICSNNVKFSGFKVIGENQFPWAGIYVYYSNNCNLSDNIILHNYVGIYLYDSSHIIFRNNSLVCNRFGVRIWGLVLDHFIHDISPSNKINGKEILYIINADKIVINSGDNVGYVGIVNSTRISVRGLYLSGNSEGLLLAYARDCTVENVTLEDNERGVRIVACGNITIHNCSVMNNAWAGFTLDSSSQISIDGNLVSNNFYGISCSYSPLLAKETVGNVIRQNLILRNDIGLFISEGNMNLIESNYFMYNNMGFLIVSSYNNEVSRNTFEKNNLALNVVNSGKNSFYFNSFIDNCHHVKVSSSSRNFWNLGYPLGGNFWSDFVSCDRFSGAGQNETGCDGLIDQPYFIDSWNVDMYPQLFPVKSFIIEPVNGMSFTVDSFSNASSWINFNYSYAGKFLLFVNPNPAGISLFKVVIPREILYCNSSTDWQVYVNDHRVQADVWIEGSLTCVLINTSMFNVSLIRIVGSLMFKSPICCDVNDDGKVNFIDVMLASRSFGSSIGQSRWNPFADINSDGVVDLLDLYLIICAAFKDNYRFGDTLEFANSLLNLAPNP